jgi:hypothetical protein
VIHAAFTHPGHALHLARQTARWNAGPAPRGRRSVRRCRLAGGRQVVTSSSALTAPRMSFVFGAMERSPSLGDGGRLPLTALYPRRRRRSAPALKYRCGGPWPTATPGLPAS